MNTPSPLIPQGSLERQSKGKSTVRIAILTIVSIHAVFFAGLLMQGCRREDPSKTSMKSVDAGLTNQTTLPQADAGFYNATQEVSQASTTTPTPAPIPTNIADPLSVNPAPLPASVPETPVEGKTYTVAKGDTFAKIAKANGTTVVAIKSANPNVDPSKLKAGQKLQIPAAAAVASTGAAATSTGLGFAEPSKSQSASTGSNSGSVHTVKAGETLTKIAKQYGTTPKAIRATNNLKTDRLLVGQKIKLPAPATASVDATKTPAVSKMTATNPAHISPVPTIPTGTNVR